MQHFLFEQNAKVLKIYTDSRKNMLRHHICDETNQIGHWLVAQGRVQV